MKAESEEEELMKEISSIVYPSYPLGCSPQEFLSHYQPLFDALRSFDRATDLKTIHQLPLYKRRGLELSSKSKEEEEITEHIVMTIIDILNKSCSHCHRKEYSQHIFNLLAEFKGNLKDLAIGKTPIRFSAWVALLDIESPTALYYGIKEHEVLATYDQLFQQYHYIPHRQTFLLNYTSVAVAMRRFEEVLKGTQNSLPPFHQHYLAIIASATYGCKYLWSRSVADFLKAGGELAWIQQGSTAVPAILKEMSKFSTMVAYNFKELDKQNIFGSSNSSEHQYRLIALIWICYYQALACIDLVCGFIPENYDYFKYLPDLPNIRPSLGSFEAVKRTEGMDSLDELRTAQEFASLYSWDSDKQEEIQVKIQGARSIDLSKSHQNRKRTESLPDLRENEIYLLGRVQSAEICEKISNLQSLKYLQSVFDKYVHLQPLLSNFSSRTSTTRPLLEDSLVLASDWDFELKGLNRIQLVLGSKVRQSLQNLVHALRVEDSQKSKQLKHYYQFFNNYMYQYESYTKLMKSISIHEKNYLKLVTKSPFLFTEQAFLRMKNDLSKAGIDPLDFLMEAVSFKLELSVNLLSFLLDKTQSEDDCI